jgi:ribosomal-protein-serine acetyltransferase
MIRSIIRDTVTIAVLEPHHADEFLNFVTNDIDHCVQWIPFASKRKTVDEIRDLIRLFLEKMAVGSGCMYGLWDGSTIIGMILAREIDATANWAEIGYMINQQYEGRGIVRQACDQLIFWLFEERGMQKIEICCNSHNARSIGLATRLGFRHEGTLRRHARINGELCDLACYGLLKEEWDSGRR